ncbi:hypothetical protein SAMD00019534_020450 [Acytostelium subglobosum LB1]|uniref:hypothetical protein n=1 Tax=Acytostelium subglobosum LB1 TaxID=1410327 RepID=UPI000644A0BC|nr:hypothetical protein SAMD00019534_020450 [Acytostelium subglobosum LB1]GAM18870.1 hypothetical protein SAMD00019534_020450 [Acytostelium subglobosum LB1]|eukprot:XP_012758090.1 hypothetical protein SAMD00019534_020450 [Acytostelium subglobosum LB1]
MISSKSKKKQQLLQQQLQQQQPLPTVATAMSTSPKMESINNNSSGGVGGGGSINGMSPISIAKHSHSPPMPSVNARGAFSHKSPPLEMVSHFKEKIQQLGWIGSPQTLGSKTRQRSNSMAVGSPGSPGQPLNLFATLEQISKELEEREKDVQLAAEIGKMLLDKNNELEYQVSQLFDYERRYHDEKIQSDIIKKQNETLKSNIKEATLVNEMLVEKMNDNNTEMNSIRQKYSKSSKSSKKNADVNVDELHQEIEDLSSKEISMEKSIIKLKCENESLVERNESIESKLTEYESDMKELEHIKEKYHFLSVKNNSLIGLAKDIATRKSIIDEYNMFKDNFEVTLENILACATSQERYDHAQEMKLIKESKDALDQIRLDDHDHNNHVVKQLLSQLREKDDMSSSFLEESDIQLADDSSDHNIDEVESQLAKQIEISAQNLSRSSILLLIAIYIGKRHQDVNDQLTRNNTSMLELQEDIKELTEKLQTNTKLNTKLEMESLSNSNLIEELQQRTELLQNEIKTLQQSCAQLQTERDDSIKSLQAEQAAKQVAISALQEEAERRHNQLEAQLKQVESEYRLLQEQQSKQKPTEPVMVERAADPAAEATLRDLNSKYMELAMRYAQLMSSQDGQQFELKQKDNRIEQLMGQLAEITAKHSAAEQDNVILKQSVAALEAQVANKDQDIARMSNDLEEARLNIAKLEDADKIMKQKTLDMSKTLADRDQIIADLKKELDDMGKELAVHKSSSVDVAEFVALQDRLQQAESDLAHAKDDQSQKEREIAELSTRIKALEEKYQALELVHNACSANDEDLAQQIAEAASLKTALAQRDNTINEMTETLSRMRDELAELRLQNDDNIALLKRDHNEIIESLNKKIEELSRDLEQLQSKDSEVDAKIKNLLDNANVLLSKLDDKDKIVTSLQEDIAKLENELHEMNENYNRKQLELEAQLKKGEEAKIELDNIARELAEQRKPKTCLECVEHQSNLERVNKEHEDELIRMSQRECLECAQHLEKIKGMDDVHKTQEKDYNDLVNMLQLHKKQVEEMRAHVDQIKNQPPAECDTCSSLRDEIDALRRELDDLRKSNQSLRSSTEVERNELKKSHSLIMEKEAALFRQQQEEQKKLEKEQELIQLEKKKLEATLASVGSVVDTGAPHRCTIGSLINKEYEMIAYINQFLPGHLILSLQCRQCVSDKLRDGHVFCNVINHFINDCIDSRALHQQPCSPSDMDENLALVLNSVKVFGGYNNFNGSDLVSSNNDNLFKLLFEILYIGFLQRVSLLHHPELAALWKGNNKDSDQSDESWDNFITLEPHLFIKRWVNHFIKLAGGGQSPISKEFTSDENIFTTLLSQLYPDYSSSSTKTLESMLEYCKTLGCTIVTQADIRRNDQHCIILFLAQLFDKKSGLSLPKDQPMESITSPDIAPSSEEKAAKQWLKTLDISTSSLDDFRDGLLLLRALDQVSPGLVNWKSVNMHPSNMFTMTENCNYVVKLGKQLKFILVGISGSDFVNCNKKYLLSFVWQMMRYSVLKKVNLKGKDGKDITEADLVSWANNKVQASGKTTSIKSLSDSTLKDSSFLLDLLNSLSKGCIDYSLVLKRNDGESNKSNARYVISVARRLGSQTIIFWEDIVEVKSNMIMLFILDLMTLLPQ